MKLKRTPGFVLYHVTPKRKDRPGVYWYFTLNARNGRVLMHSETYTKKSNAEKGIKSAKYNLAWDNVTEVNIYDHQVPKNIRPE